MQAFIEFSEKEYAQLGSDGEVASHALELFDKAIAAVPSNSVHGKRIALVDGFLTTLRSRAKQMNEPRPEGLPNYRLIDMGKDKWTKARASFTMDGKLDEEFWTAYNYPRTLREIRTKAKPNDATRFMARWWNGSLYFGIRCEFREKFTPLHIA